MGTGPIALLGSGEFEPWQDEVDRQLLAAATGDGSVLILPTASASEGDEVFGQWGSMGREHYRRLGIAAEVLPLKTRADAELPALADRLGQASLVFFSGGNPAYLAEVLAGSRFWETLRAEMERGLAYAGCSAGVAALGDVAPDSTLEQLVPEIWRPGLGLFPGTWLMPHWSELDDLLPGASEYVVGSLPPGVKLVTVDTTTAAVGNGQAWTVVGSGRVGMHAAGAWTRFGPGETFALPTVAGRPPRRR